MAAYTQVLKALSCIGNCSQQPISASPRLRQPMHRPLLIVSSLTLATALAPERRAPCTMLAAAMVKNANVKGDAASQYEVPADTELCHIPRSQAQMGVNIVLVQ